MPLFYHYLALKCSPLFSFINKPAVLFSLSLFSFFRSISSVYRPPGCTQSACFSFLHLRYGARLRRCAPHVLSHDRVAIYQLLRYRSELGDEYRFLLLAEATHSRTSASNCRHSQHTNIGAPPDFTRLQLCGPLCVPHPLTAASADWILMDFQPRFQIRIPVRLLVPPSTARPAAAIHRSLTKVQGEKTASDAYPHPCSGDEWESHLLSACI